MLSMKKLKMSQGNYYLQAAKQEYYLPGGDPSGHWQGHGAEVLGLSGMVESDTFRNLLMGWSPDSIRSLVQIQKADKHLAGWDLTFSAPKAVSTLWSQADQPTQVQIVACHDRAVRRAIAFLEQTAAYTRRGKNGHLWESVGLVVAEFIHTTSRAHDPQLHSHCIVMNVAPRADGSWGAIESRTLFQAKMVAGALYRAELAAQLREQLGLIALNAKASFDLAGVPDSLCREFSTRRKDILAELHAQGIYDARSAATATLKTRKAKVSLPQDQLLEDWQATGRIHGFSQEQVAELISGTHHRVSVDRSVAEVISLALHALTHQQSYFSQKELLLAIAQEAPVYALGMEAVRGLATVFLNSAEVVHLGMVGGEEKFTTKDMIELETGMVACAERLRSSQINPVSEYIGNDVLLYSELSPEQQTAVRQITTSPGQIKLLTGLAGTGKTSTMKAIRFCFERAGYTVKGVSLSAKAARGLQEGAGIVSTTIHQLQIDLERHKQAVGEMASVPLQANTVLVVDESSMVGTHQLAALLIAVEQAGGIVILTGDARQLQAIEAGGAFAALASRLGQAELTTVVRQREAWAREAVINLAHGEAETALRAFADHGLLHIAEDRNEAVRTLIADWRQDALSHIKDRLILASTNREVEQLNCLAQHARQSAGALGERSVTVGNLTVYEGDRLLFTRNDRLRGVQNGMLGTVAKINAATSMLTVTLDSGSVVSFQATAFPDFRLGYAVTTHKGQGMTVECASVLLGGAMQDQELSYVMASRARTRTRLYTDTLTAGDDLSELVRQMSTSHQKELAVEALERHQLRAPLALQRR